jgi:hypothetical protein
MASDNIETTYSWLRAAGFMKGPIAMTKTFESYTSWSDVLGDADRGVQLHYHAPMDLRPVFVWVIKIFKNGKIRITNGIDCTFTADAGHLSRFRRAAR